MGTYTSIRRPRPSFGIPNKSSPFAVTSIKWPSSAWYTYFGFISRIWSRKIQSERKGDDPSWTVMLLPSRAFLFFQNKVLFLLKVMMNLYYWPPFTKRPLAGRYPEGGRSMEIFATKVRIFTLVATSTPQQWTASVFSVFVASIPARLSKM